MSVLVKMAREKPARGIGKVDYSDLYFYDQDYFDQGYQSGKGNYSWL